MEGGISECITNCRYSLAFFPAAHQRVPNHSGLHMFIFPDSSQSVTAIFFPCFITFFCFCLPILSYLKLAYIDGLDGFGIRLRFFKLKKNNNESILCFCWNYLLWPSLSVNSKFSSVFLPCLATASSSCFLPRAMCPMDLQ